MKHFIVNIGCEYGSGGPDIGKMVAESLGIPFYDRDLVDQVVEKLGVDRDLVEKADSGEENVKYEFDTTFGPRYANLTNRVIYTQFEVIHKLAAKSSCVIIGRCSDVIVEDAFRVFISSGLKKRVERILALEKEPDEDVKKLESRIRAIDAKRRDYYQYYSGNEWGKPKNYDLCLNSGTLGIERCVEIIANTVSLE
mgnify:CR=1 FL=1